MSYKKGNYRKKEQLGMHVGTASAILRKSLLFSMAKKLGMCTCFQCGNVIEGIDDFSIEHKVAWLDSNNPKELFFSLDNIAFSHLRCNSLARSRSGARKETDQVACKNCGVLFEKETRQIRYWNKRNQTDFYCSSSCSGKSAGKGYSRIKDIDWRNR